MNRTRVRLEAPDPAIVEVLHTRTPQERLSIAFGMGAAARKMLINLLASSHPKLDQNRLRKEVARRLSGGSV
jgi:hypothetical protein